MAVATLVPKQQCAFIYCKRSGEYSKGDRCREYEATGKHGFCTSHCYAVAKAVKTKRETDSAKAQKGSLLSAFINERAASIEESDKPTKKANRNSVEFIATLPKPGPFAADDPDWNFLGTPAAFAQLELDKIDFNKQLNI